MFRKTASIVAMACLCALCAVVPARHAQAARPHVDSPAAVPQITAAIDPQVRHVLAGNTNARITTGAFIAPLDADAPLDNLLLSLRRSDARQAALDAFVARQHDPRSTQFHEWLTPTEFGQAFGPAQADIDTIVGWLKDGGFKVNAVAAGGMTIDFSGTVAQVDAAFGASMGTYDVDGVTYLSNSRDPSIPAALAPAIAGIVSLNNAFTRPHLRRAPRAPLLQASQWSGRAAAGRSARMVRYLPLFNYTDPDGDQEQLVAPGDFNTIYNIDPLWNANITGAGQSITVIERTKIKQADWNSFRSAFGLSGHSGTFTQVVGPGCSNPGQLASGDQGEAALDAEWASAAAPDAGIVLLACKSTALSDGIDLAVNATINLPTPPTIASLSYGSCESDLGAAGNNQYFNYWQQAAAEGMTVFVSAGDEGAAGCDADSHASAPYGWATHGIAVSGLASTAYNVAVGGTDFRDAFDGTVSTYWNTADNTAAPYVSALSYIPEIPWNSSCASSILLAYRNAHGGNYADSIDYCNSTSGRNLVDVDGGSGGPSAKYARPGWQSVYGGPDASARGLPDVSLFSSSGFWGHGLVFCMSDTNAGGTACDYSVSADVYANTAGGTSFAAPALAGIQALVNQATGQSWGNMNTQYYALAAQQYGAPGSPNTARLAECDANLGNGIGSTCVFNDVTSGDITVPCKNGSADCYSNLAASVKGNNCGSGTTSHAKTCGILSTSTSSAQPAYGATPGWDFATGLGSLNVANLVAAMLPQQFAIGGLVHGLASGSVELTLTDSTAAATQVASFGNGVFAFQAPLPGGDDWSVAVTGQPTGQTCIASNNAGTNIAADVANIDVGCSIDTFTLDYAAGTNGSLSGNTHQTGVAYGSAGTPVTAMADAGYHFVQWSDGSTANPRTDANVTADLSVTASFAADTFTLDYAAGANGSISGNAHQTGVAYGSDGTPVTAVADAGYHFEQWSDASTANPRTDVDVGANLSVTAQFGVNVLVFAAQPTSLAQGDAVGLLTVTEEDGHGNVVSDSATLDFQVGTACGALDLGNAAMVGGVATLDVAQRFYRTGSALAFSATITDPAASPIAPAASAPFDVLPNGDLVFSDGFESCQP